MPAEDPVLDLAVPESPAFTLLGLSPQNVVRPATPRILATSLLSGVDRNGNFQAGLALDVSPYMLFAGDSLTIEEYRKEENWWKRVLANIQVSLATTKGAEKADDAVRLGFGVRTILWNQGDPRQDLILQDCLLTNLKPPLLTAFPNKDAWGEAFKAYPEKGAPIAAKCQAESEKRNWNASSLELAVAPSFIQKTGSDDNIAFGGAAFWTSLAWGFDGIKSLKDTSQLIFHVRYTLDQETPDPNIKDRFFKQDTLITGLRVRIGKPTLNVSFEGNFIHADPEGARSDNSYSASLGTDIKVANNIWLQLAVGGTRH